MEVFGWIMLVILALVGCAILVIFALPFFITEFKTLSYRIKKAVQDKTDDIDKRSEERKHRDEIKREKDFELANKKLDAKLLKVDKKIEIQTKKLKMANELKVATKEKKENLAKSKSEKVVEKSTIEYAIPETEETIEKTEE